jgi:predicted nucleic acid-binding protein
MSDERFTLDTNILVYGLDRRADVRHTLAVEIIRQARNCDCWLTLQSVSEFYAAATRKRIIAPTEAAAQANDWLDMFPSIPASATAVRTALASAATGRASYWDALLTATAAEAGCVAILTEDLSDGTHLYGLRVVRPFDGEHLTQAARDLLGSA